jgi:hypothetical protein
MAINLAAVPAYAADILEFGDNANADDAVVLGPVTYVFKAEPAEPGEVELGSSQADSMEALIDAINLGTVAPALVPNPAVVARQIGSDSILIVARMPGAVGNPGPAEVTVGGARLDLVGGGGD